MASFSLPAAVFAGFLAAVLYVPDGPRPAAPAKACSGAEFRQFDFWIGEWDVVNQQGRPAGTNRITDIESGCALLERWTGAGGATGTSLTFYDRADGRWHQAWMDGKGQALRLSGGCRGSRMVLESTRAEGRVERVSWTRVEGGRLRQVWESSSDEGKTWTVVFDGTYIKRPK